MQVQDKQSQDEIIAALQRQVNELTADKLLLEEQLEQKEQFTAMIAHELAGPLTSIISYAQMLARPNQREEMIQRGSIIIVGQARRLDRLVHDLLDVSRLSSGQFTLLRKSCDIAALSKEIVEQLRPVAPYHQFIVDTPDTPVIGNWDSMRLQQALGNLLDNAIKYSDPDTPITVRLKILPHAVQVSVHNLGASIPEGDAGLLFRPFVRLEGATDRQGSGLGLYITRCIIEAHGGVIDLPTAEDEGITFSFELPLS
jgi:signal transduction histidine kinase